MTLWLAVWGCLTRGSSPLIGHSVTDAEMSTRLAAMRNVISPPINPRSPTRPDSLNSWFCSCLLCRACARPNLITQVTSSRQKVRSDLVWRSFDVDAKACQAQSSQVLREKLGFGISTQNPNNRLQVCTHDNVGSTCPMLWFPSTNSLQVSRLLWTFQIGKYCDMSLLGLVSEHASLTRSQTSTLGDPSLRYGRLHARVRAHAFEMLMD